MFNKFRAIHAHYRTPRIVMSPAVRWSLLVLRGYLIVLVLLMIYKFAVMAGA